MIRAALPLLALTLTLAACGGDKKQEGAGKAEGEVLPGSASDAMLPYDTVKSQAPLAPRSEGGEDKSGAKKVAAPKKDDAAEAPVEEPGDAAPATPAQ